MATGSSVTLKAAVYRLQLFKPSEGFIAAQAKALPTATVRLVGRALFGPPDSQLGHVVPANLGGAALARFLATASTAAFEPLLREFGPDLIHAHFSVDGLYALPLARRLARPLVTTLHGFDITTARRHFFSSGRPALVRYALFQKRLKRQGDHFICVSRFMHQAALRAGFPESRCSVHYMGIDTSLFNVTPVSGPPRLVHVARLVEKKGTRYLLEAVGRLRTRFPELTVDVIGDGPLRGSLAAQAASLGLAAAVRFHGTRPPVEVRKMLEGATALVLPSVTAANGDAEGLGLVLLEASASGIPVIGTRHGGIPEAVSDGETGFLVPERDSGALAEAIGTIVADEPLRQRMGVAGRRLACERFDIRRQSSELESLYRRFA